MEAILSDRLYLHGIPTETITGLNEHLRITNPKWQDVKRFSRTGGRYTSVSQFIYAGEVLGDHDIALPRSVILPAELLPSKLLELDIKDKRNKSPITFPPLRVTLNSMQKAVAVKFKQIIAEDIPPAFLLKAGTSFGKTICMLNLARIAKQKTLVLTHRQLIFDTWVADIDKAFAGATTAGIVRQSKIRIGEHYTVAMLQTLDRWDKDDLAALFAEFGTVILDEAHICPMPFIEGVVSRCPALYRIGGTATISRKGGRDKMLYWVFGKPFFSTTDTSTVKGNQLSISEARIVVTKFEYEPAEDDVFDIHELDHKIIRDVARNKLIVENVLKDVDAGHSVLVTTFRKKHCLFLVRRLKKLGYNPVLLMGDRTQGRAQFDKEVEDIKSGKRRLVVATEQLIREGTNIPPLDRLHVAMSISDRKNAVQLFGRICRASPETGKTDAKVTIYFDVRTVSLRRRVTHNMIPVLRGLGVPNVQNMFIA